MSADPLTMLIRDLNQSMLALATIGAALRLEVDGHQPDPAVGDAVSSALRALGAPCPASLAPEQAGQALGLIQTFFAEAHDLLRFPTRPPGWRFEDPAVLQAIGTSSAGMVGRIAALAETRPSLAGILAGSGTFLDVGTGVGGLALAAAATWPALSVVGIDRWPPALALAERNRATSLAAARVRFEHRDLEQLDDSSRYSLAWLPTPFVDKEVTERGLARLGVALAPGGILIVGVIPPPQEALPAALGRLRARRNGGHSWPCAEMEALLRDAGFAEVETPPGQAGMHFILARKPPGFATVP